MVVFVFGCGGSTFTPYHFDHFFVLFRFNQSVSSGQNKVFRFEAWCILEDSLEETIKSNWSLLMGDLLDKLTGLHEALLVWARSIKRRRKGIKESLTRELEDLLEADTNNENLEKLIDTKLHLNTKINKEERFWEQCARVN